MFDYTKFIAEMTKVVALILTLKHRIEANAMIGYIGHMAT